MSNPRLESKKVSSKPFDAQSVYEVTGNCTDPRCPKNIGVLCMQTYPCQHYVTLNDDSEILMFEPEINLLLKKYNVTCPKFTEGHD